MTIDEMKQKKTERGYSYSMMSELSGIPLGTIQKIFSGETTHPRYDTLMALEKLLYVISGNMDAASYTKLLNENVFGTKLYEDYIRYRMDCIFAKGMKSLEAKKTLLEELNKIV